jgi:hypothetical protein
LYQAINIKTTPNKTKLKSKKLNMTSYQTRKEATEALRKAFEKKNAVAFHSDEGIAAAVHCHEVLFANWDLLYKPDNDYTNCGLIIRGLTNLHKLFSERVKVLPEVRTFDELLSNLLLLMTNDCHNPEMRMVLRSHVSVKNTTTEDIVNIVPMLMEHTTLMRSVSLKIGINDPDRFLLMRLTGVRQEENEEDIDVRTHFGLRSFIRDEDAENGRTMTMDGYNTLRRLRDFVR